MGVAIALIVLSIAGYVIFGNAFIFFAVISTVFAAVYFFSSVDESIRKDSEMEVKQREYIEGKVSVYKVELAKKRMQLLVKDEYGDLDDRKWKAEMVSFFNKKIGSIPAEIAKSSQPRTISAEEIVRIIERVSIQGELELQDELKFSDEMDGVEYEHCCARLLRASGWDAWVSSASNDQGVDIVAKGNGVVVAIQCKKYSTPVGNKAVQEVSAGKSHYRADYAVVVSNSTFTTAAKQLAKSAKVVLLHHGELNELSKHLKIRSG